jgi:putative heme-binding domain-containing protein
VEERWSWIEPLVAKAEDAQDRNLPLLNWYAIEPSVVAQPERGLALALSAKQARLPEFVARRITSAALEAGQSAGLDKLCQALHQATSAQRESMLTGILAAMNGQARVPAPAAWEETYALLAQDPAPAVRGKARETGVIFNGKAALAELRALASDPAQSVEIRNSALAALANQEDPSALTIGLELIERDGPLRGEALRALARFDDPRITERVIALLPAMSASTQRDAITLLVSRLSGAKELLAGIDSGKLPLSLMSAPVARAIQGFKVPELDAWLEKHWGTLKTTSEEKKAEIARYKKFLSPDQVASADVKRGKELFRGSCALCHQMFGTGGEVGPHLTGGFTDLDYLLENLLDPNGAIGKDYQMVILTLTDGSLQAGIISAEDGNSVTLKIPGLPEPATVAKSRIKSREVSPNSLMPEGLLNGLQEPDVRNLFLYLRQTAEIP